MALKHVVAVAAAMLAFNTAAQADQTPQDLGRRLSTQVANIIPDQMRSTLKKFEAGCANVVEGGKKACFTNQVLLELKAKFAPPCRVDRIAAPIADIYLKLRDPNVSNQALTDGWNARYREEAALNSCDRARPIRP